MWLGGILPNISANKADRVEIEVPGKLNWFKQGTPEHQRWCNEWEKFLKYIKEDSKEGNEIISDILDGILGSEVPTGVLHGISIALKNIKKGRSKRIKRKTWRNIVTHILQRTYTDTSEHSDDLKFEYPQINRIWKAYWKHKTDISIDDYELLYSNIDTKLRAGKLRNKILIYPELTRYTDYKLRQYKAYYHYYYIFFKTGKIIKPKGGA